LKLAANAQTGNLVLLKFSQILPFEVGRTLGGFGFAGNHIQKRGFARTVGANNHPQFPFIHAEVEVVEGFEAIKADGDILNV
jgi:hypothetical protein